MTATTRAKEETLIPQSPLFAQFGQRGHHSHLTSCQFYQVRFLQDDHDDARMAGARDTEFIDGYPDIHDIAKTVNRRYNTEQYVQSVSGLHIYESKARH